MLYIGGHRLPYKGKGSPCILCGGESLVLENEENENKVDYDNATNMKSGVSSSCS